jgi:hypothetical protein
MPDAARFLAVEDRRPYFSLLAVARPVLRHQPHPAITEVVPGFAIRCGECGPTEQPHRQVLQHGIELQTIARRVYAKCVCLVALRADDVHARDPFVRIIVEPIGNCEVVRNERERRITRLHIDMPRHSIRGCCAA